MQADTKPFENSNLTEKPKIDIHNVMVYSNRLIGDVFSYPEEHNLQPEYTGINVGNNPSQHRCNITTSPIVNYTEDLDGVSMFETKRSKYIVRSWVGTKEQNVERYNSEK